MFNKIKSVSPIHNMFLLVEFMNGIKKQYDVKPLLNRIEIFKDLQNPYLFNLVRVDKGGYGIVWNDDIDLSCDELWEHGVSV